MYPQYTSVGFRPNTFHSEASRWEFDIVLVLYKNTKQIFTIKRAENAKFVDEFLFVKLIICYYIWIIVVVWIVKP